MKLWRLRLLEFYDHKTTESGFGGHVSAITGLFGEDLILALLCDFWRRQGIQSEVVSYSCNAGSRSGHRLDAWLLQRTDPPVLFQTEVKNWSAHSIGGRELRVDSDDDTKVSYASEHWRRYFAADKNIDESIAKVLEPMMPPDNCKATRILPLIAFWFVIAEKDAHQPYSIKTLPTGGHFQELHVFSASNYLRSLNADWVELELPRYARRHELLNKLFAR